MSGLIAFFEKLSKAHKKDKIELLSNWFKRK